MHCCIVVDDAKMLCARPSHVVTTNTVLVAVAGPICVATSAASGASRFSPLSTNPSRQLECVAIERYFFFPVTSSHASPRSFLILSTFFQASSFILRNTARPAA
jgi:hypothetical protein